jgi:hypothetical protein
MFSELTEKDCNDYEFEFWQDPIDNFATKVKIKEKQLKFEREYMACWVDGEEIHPNIENIELETVAIRPLPIQAMPDNTRRVNDERARDRIQRGIVDIVHENAHNAFTQEEITIVLVRIREFLSRMIEQRVILGYDIEEEQDLFVGNILRFTCIALGGERIEVTSVL